MTFGIPGFIDAMLGMNHHAVEQDTHINNSMMTDIQHVAEQQMKMQTQMSQIALVTKLNEALAKMTKAIGDSVKNLAG
jgi:predicted transcriptional regulator